MALATGLIQGGTTVKMAEKKKRERVNNIDALKQKLSVLKNSLEWTERLDITVNIAVSSSNSELITDIINSLKLAKMGYH